MVVLKLLALKSFFAFIVEKHLIKLQFLDLATYNVMSRCSYICKKKLSILSNVLNISQMFLRINKG